MSAVDFRRIIDVGRFAFVAVEVDDPRAERPIVLQLQHVGNGPAQRVALDYSEAGSLFDTLSQALAIVVAGHSRPELKLVVEHALEVVDTPPSDGSRPLS